MALYIPPSFAAKDRVATERLIHDYPFATLVTPAAPEPWISHIPLLMTDAGIRLHPYGRLGRLGITLCLQCRDHANAIVAHPILRQLEFRIESPDRHLERDNGADQRVALAVGHRELPRCGTSALEPADQGVENAAGRCRIVKDLEWSMRVDRREIPRRHCLRGFHIPGR